MAALQCALSQLTASPRLYGADRHPQQCQCGCAIGKSLRIGVSRQVAPRRLHAAKASASPRSSSTSSPPVSFPLKKCSPIESSTTEKAADSAPLPAFDLSAILGRVETAVCAVFLAAAVLVGVPDAAVAASGGGRIGGKAFGGGGYSAPSQVYTAPPQASSTIVAVPYYAPSPFGFSPFGWSPFSFGPSIVLGGGGVLTLIAVLAIFYFVTNTFLSNSDDDLMATETTSVVRLQVGLLGMARSLQQDLDRLADSADTSSPDGLHMLLTETVLSLLRQPAYCVYGRSSSSVTDYEEGESLFNQQVMEERSKFARETLVNVDSMQRRMTRAPAAERFTSEFIVVTVVVAAEGRVELPPVNSVAELQQALTKLGSIRADQIQAVEILWTPQDVDDTLSAKEVIEDYPLLRPL
eukprot:TRINITY_DN26194_c0_g1_i1.p1 TRINITY_DN26194_c0_g1~~TRINITY_DN26194_c0_g1_i1.p1  ORF type:complete len:409 (+),score=82.95 TRINITY_DN26194_c0_g1_i1:161-1387(+)